MNTQKRAELPSAYGKPETRSTTVGAQCEHRDSATRKSKMKPNARYYIITPDEKPPTGLMGGGVHEYTRGRDPFARECMPTEFQDRFPDNPAATGWLALDWCGNVIAFAQEKSHPATWIHAQSSKSNRMISLATL